MSILIRLALPNALNGGFRADQTPAAESRPSTIDHGKKTMLSEIATTQADEYTDRSAKPGLLRLTALVVRALKGGGVFCLAQHGVFGPINPGRFSHSRSAFHTAGTAVGAGFRARFGLDASEVTQEVFTREASGVFDQAKSRMQRIKAGLGAKLGA